MSAHNPHSQPAHWECVTDSQGKIWELKGPDFWINGRVGLSWAELMEAHGPIEKYNIENIELTRLQKTERRYISQFLEMLANEYLMASEDYEVLNRAAEMIRREE